jgi:hypothetical protein
VVGFGLLSCLRYLKGLQRAESSIMFGEDIIQIHPGAAVSIGYSRVLIL